MGRLVVIEFLTVDGVMQGLGSAQEDTDSGFTHGGWGAPYAESIHQVMGAEGLDVTTAYLFGRRTYEKMADFWPHQGQDNPIAAHMNNTHKYVASTTLTEAAWPRTTILAGELVDDVGRLKSGTAGDIAVLGSGVVARQLLARGVVDQLRLFIHPLLLGTGKRLFTELPQPRRLALSSVAHSDLGTVALVYDVLAERSTP